MGGLGYDNWLREPYEQEMEKAKTCTGCEDEIYVGDSYFSVGSEDLCESCIADIEKTALGTSSEKDCEMCGSSAVGSLTYLIGEEAYGFCEDCWDDFKHESKRVADIMEGMDYYNY